MPTVRTYERSVTTAPVQGGRLTAAQTEISEGAGVERANQQRALQIAAAAKEGAQIGLDVFQRQEAERRREAEEARQFANEMQVIEGRNKLDAKQRDYLYDTETGVYTKKGKAAFGLPEEVDAEFEKMVSEIGETMVTPEQKLGWARVVQQERTRTQLEVRRYVDKEIQTYTANETQARVANGIASTVRMSTTPDADGHVDPSRGLGELNQTIADFKAVAPKMGLTPEQVEQQERDIRTKAHEGTIRTLIADQKPQAAKVYFEEVSKQIDPERHDEIKAMLKTGGVRAEAQKETEKILANTKLTTLEQQRAEAKKIADPEVQDEVLQRIEHENVVRKQQEQVAKEETSVKIANILDAKRSVSAIPADIWNNMNMAQRDAARSYVKDLIDKGQPTTDLRFLYSLYDEADRNPVEFAKRALTDPTTMSRLSRADFEQVMVLQRNVRQGNKDAANEGLEGYRTSTQIVDSILNAAGYDTSPKPGTKEAASVDRLRDAVDQEVRALKTEKAAKGQKVGTEDIKAITDTMMKKVVTEKGSGSLWDILKFGGNYSDVEKRIGEVTIDDVPQTDRADIRDALVRRGRVPTEAEVVRLYRLKLARDAASKPAATAAPRPSGSSSSAITNREGGTR